MCACVGTTWHKALTESDYYPKCGWQKKCLEDKTSSMIGHHLSKFLLCGLCVSCTTVLYSGTCVLWTPLDLQKCPDCKGILIFQIILYEKVPFRTYCILRVWIMQVSIFSSVQINRFQCSEYYSCRGVIFSKVLCMFYTQDANERLKPVPSIPGDRETLLRLLDRHQQEIDRLTGYPCSTVTAGYSSLCVIVCVCVVVMCR